jgi:hypothetical protein
MLRDNLVFNRRLDRGNPNPGNIGSDFNRLNLVFGRRPPSQEPRPSGSLGRIERMAKCDCPPGFQRGDVAGWATTLDFGPGSGLA